MKKLIVMVTLILCLGFSLAFAQELTYTGFMKTIIDPAGVAIINEDVYSPGQIVVLDLADQIAESLVVQNHFVQIGSVGQSFAGLIVLDFQTVVCLGSSESLWNLEIQIDRTQIFLNRSPLMTDLEIPALQETFLSILY